MQHSNKKINMLLLGAGKRVEAARLFKIAAEMENFDLQLFSYESDQLRPISSEAFIIPHANFNSENIQFDIKRLIEMFKIDICLGFHDGVLGVIPEISKMVFAPSMSQKLVDTFRSKALSKEFLRLHGLPTPENTNQIPAIAKPLYGSASKGILIFKDQRLLDQFFADELSSNYVVEDLISGPEFTIDCYKALNSNSFSAVARERIEISGGEVVRTKIVKNDSLLEIATTFSKINGVAGPFNIQVIQDSKTLNYSIMEVNPRFAGGVTTSLNAGMPWFQNLFRDFLGIKLLENNVRFDTTITRALVDFVHFPEISNEN